MRSRSWGRTHRWVFCPPGAGLPRESEKKLVPEWERRRRCRASRGEGASRSQLEAAAAGAAAAITPTQPGRQGGPRAREAQSPARRAQPARCQRRTWEPPAPLSRPRVWGVRRGDGGSAHLKRSRPESEVFRRHSATHTRRLHSSRDSGPHSGCSRSCSQRAGGGGGGGGGGGHPSSPPPAGRGWKRPSTGLVQGGVTAAGWGVGLGQCEAAQATAKPDLGSNFRPTKPLTAWCLSFPTCKTGLRMLPT